MFRAFTRQALEPAALASGKLPPRRSPGRLALRASRKFPRSRWKFSRARPGGIPARSGETIGENRVDRLDGIALALRSDACPVTSFTNAPPPAHQLLTLRARPLRIALVGQPNVGKSVVFGRLTGRYVTVSNYPGHHGRGDHGPRAGRRRSVRHHRHPGRQRARRHDQRRRADHARRASPATSPTSSSRWPTRATCAAR